MSAALTTGNTQISEIAPVPLELRGHLPLSSWLSLHGFKAAQQKIPPLPRVSLSLRENTVGDLLQKQNCQTWNYLFVIIRNIVKCPPLSDSGGLDDPDLLRRS